MKRLTLVALLILTPFFAVACSSGGAETTTTAAPQVGVPDPPLPMDINTMPFKPSELVALGNASIQIDTPITAEDGTFSFNVSITSGALEPISITPEMFRVYTLDGKSYISDTAPGTEQFGDRTLQSKEVYSGTFSVKIPTDSEPVMFLADLRPIGDRHFPGAWVFFFYFTTEPSEG